MRSEALMLEIEVGSGSDIFVHSCRMTRIAFKVNKQI